MYIHRFRISKQALISRMIDNLKAKQSNGTARNSPFSLVIAFFFSLFRSLRISRVLLSGGTIERDPIKGSPERERARRISGYKDEHLQARRGHDPSLERHRPPPQDPHHQILRRYCSSLAISWFPLFESWSGGFLLVFDVIYLVLFLIFGI